MYIIIIILIHKYIYIRILIKYVDIIHISY
jgi:hypothetical protein